MKSSIDCMYVCIYASHCIDIRSFVSQPAAHIYILYVFNSICCDIILRLPLMGAFSLRGKTVIRVRLLPFPWELLPLITTSLCNIYNWEQRYGTPCIQWYMTLRLLRLHGYTRGHTSRSRAVQSFAWKSRHSNFVAPHIPSYIRAVHGYHHHGI